MKKVRAFNRVLARFSSKCALRISVKGSFAFSVKICWAGCTQNCCVTCVEPSWPYGLAGYLMNAYLVRQGESLGGKARIIVPSRFGTALTVSYEWQEPVTECLHTSLRNVCFISLLKALWHFSLKICWAGCTQNCCVICVEPSWPYGLAGYLMNARLVRQGESLEGKACDIVPRGWGTPSWPVGLAG